MDQNRSQMPSVSSFSLEEEAAVEAACREHEATHGGVSKNKAAQFFFGPYLVKYGGLNIIASYTQMQSLLWNATESSTKPRIPKLIHHFDNGQGKAFAVIEVIKLVESPSLGPDLDKRIADAVRWLSGVPAPSKHKLGPLGGGRIRHAFFLDSEAPLPFVDVKALNRYLEKVCAVHCLYFLVPPMSY